MDAIRSILVPTDFSPHANEALRVACELAKAIDAKVILFHIATPPLVVSEKGQLLSDLGKAMPGDLWDRFRDTQLADPKIRLEHQVIVVDKPHAKHVLEVLDKLGCDLIVMGTHGHSWLRHRLFGSVTEEVVRLARCPVMVVKAPVKAADAPISAPEQAATT